MSIHGRQGHESFCLNKIDFGNSVLTQISFTVKYLHFPFVSVEKKFFDYSQQYAIFE